MQSLSENLFFITRRILIIIFALTYDQPDNSYIAIFVFNALSLAKIFLLIIVKPLQPVSVNYSECLNETMIFSLGTLARILQDQSMAREQILAIGQVIMAIMVAAIVINMIFLACGFCRDLKNMLRKQAPQKFLKSV